MARTIALLALAAVSAQAAYAQVSAPALLGLISALANGTVIQL